MMNCLIPRLHYTDNNRDRVCLVYALMTPTELNIGAVLKSAMRKARCTKESLDYMAPLFPAPIDISKTKGSDNEFIPTLTTAEHHRRDELIMARMYGLEMLRHQNGCWASTDVQMGEIERWYPLNAHAKALLVIGPEFHEMVDGDIPTYEDRLRTGSDVDSNSEMEVMAPTQADDEADGGDAMKD
uniref:Uncharacterized protein n=1 Tax=Solanum tuberosum TaxID=4113 RepID=M1DRA7_SOLTU